MHNSPELTRYIHENFWIVMSYALAMPKYAETLKSRFPGEWKYLWKTITEAEKRANRALLELGTQLRILDDGEQLNDYLKQVGSPALGCVINKDDSHEDLYFRDMTNKILHSKQFQWDVKNSAEPTVIIISNDSERWKHAHINLLRLAGFVGQLMF